MRLYILVVILFISSCSYQKDDVILLERAEMFLETSPDSSLHILNSLELSNFKSDNNRARYALLLSEALDKNYIDITSDSIIQVAISYYSNRKASTEKAKSYYYLGRVHENAQKLEESIKAYTDASRYATKKDYNLKGLIYSSIGYLYIYQQSWEEALSMFEHASDEFLKSQNFKNLSYTLRNEGLSLFMLQDYTKALPKYNEAFDIAVNQKDTVQILILATYIANIQCFHQHDIQCARTFLIDTYEKYNDSCINKNDHALWGYIFLQDGDFENAEKYILSANDITITPHYIISIYDLHSMLYKEQGDYQNAIQYFELAQQARDSIYRIEKNTLIQDLERRYESKHLRESINSLRIKHHYQAVIIILLLIIVVFIIRKIIYDKKKRERQIAEYRSFIDRITEDHEQIKDEYSSLFKHSSELDQRVDDLKDALAERLAAIKNLVELASTSGDNTELFLKRFKKYMHLEAGKNQRLFSNLQELVNIYYSGIIDYLKSEFPKLTKEDLDFCCLIYLKIPVNGIQLMCNYTNMDSLYNRRYKLRQRLKLNSTDNLEYFLNDLLEKSSA